MEHVIALVILIVIILWVLSVAGTLVILDKVMAIKVKHMVLIIAFPIVSIIVAGIVWIVVCWNDDV